MRTTTSFRHISTCSALAKTISQDWERCFGSAGQRCSSARFLFLPAEQADTLLAGIVGAARTLTMGDPGDPAVDMGPIITPESVRNLERYTANLRERGTIIYRGEAGLLADRGSFFGPIIAEIPSLESFDTEAFGPILHVVRHKKGECGIWARALARKGFGLTLGVHSRLRSFLDQILETVPAGNVYVNRSTIGAVVGVQPFGGSGLSGTGPKAGGPHSLLRFSIEQTLTTNVAAEGGDPILFDL